jgi:hypothetical protein
MSIAFSLKMAIGPAGFAATLARALEQQARDVGAKSLQAQRPFLGSSVILFLHRMAWE